MKISPVGQYHFIMRQEIEGKAEFAIPVLYLYQKDGSIKAHTVLHQYLLAHRNLSPQWHNDRARALGLFWDFVRATDEVGHRVEPINIHRYLYRQFCEALQFGTINITDKTDPLGLHWISHSKARATTLAKALIDFVRWTVAESGGTKSPFSIKTIAALPEEQKNAHPSDQIGLTRFLIVAEHLREVSLFHHLKNTRSDAERLRASKSAEIFDFGDRDDDFDEDPAIYMNPELVAAFLQYGFVKKSSAAAPEEREDITAKMVFLLQAFGGCRISEPYHLWFNDIMPTGTFTCRAFLRNPSEAKTYLHGEDMTRREYLAKIGMVPRNEDRASRSRKAGWKKLKTDNSHSADIFWIHSGAEAMFTTLYARYLVYRKNLMAQRRLRGLPDHPFLFVSSGEDRSRGTSQIGDPYSIGAYDTAWKKALRQVNAALGTNYIQKKSDGTTSHAARHFFGQVLEEATGNKKVIQVALRHRSVLSQGVYTKPDFERVNRVITAAKDRIESGGISMMRSISFEEDAA